MHHNSNWDREAILPSFQEAKNGQKTKGLSVTAPSFLSEESHFFAVCSRKSLEISSFLKWQIIDCCASRAIENRIALLLKFLLTSSIKLKKKIHFIYFQQPINEIIIQFFV